MKDEKSGDIASEVVLLDISAEDQSVVKAYYELGTVKT